MCGTCVYLPSFFIVRCGGDGWRQRGWAAEGPQATRQARWACRGDNCCRVVKRAVAIAKAPAPHALVVAHSSAPLGEHMTKARHTSFHICGLMHAEGASTQSRLRCLPLVATCACTCAHVRCDLRPSRAPPTPTPSRSLLPRAGKQPCHAGRRNADPHCTCVPAHSVHASHPAPRRHSAARLLHTP